MRKVNLKPEPLSCLWIFFHARLPWQTTTRSLNSFTQFQHGEPTGHQMIKDIKNFNSVRTMWTQEWWRASLESIDHKGFQPSMNSNLMETPCLASVVSLDGEERQLGRKDHFFFRLQEHEDTIRLVTRDLEVINFDLCKGDGCTRLLVCIKDFISLNLNTTTQELLDQLSFLFWKSNSQPKYLGYNYNKVTIPTSRMKGWVWFKPQKINPKKIFLHSQLFAASTTFRAWYNLWMKIDTTRTGWNDK